MINQLPEDGEVRTLPDPSGTISRGIPFELSMNSSLNPYVLDTVEFSIEQVISLMEAKGKHFDPKEGLITFACAGAENERVIADNYLAHHTVNVRDGVGTIQRTHYENFHLYDRSMDNERYDYFNVIGAAHEVDIFKALRQSKDPSKDVPRASMFMMKGIEFFQRETGEQTEDMRKDMRLFQRNLPNFLTDVALVFVTADSPALKHVPGFTQIHIGDRAIEKESNMDVYLYERSVADHLTPQQHELIEKLVQETDSSTNPETLWDSAVFLAKEEQKQGFRDPQLPDVSLAEIIRFGEQLQELGSMEDKYRAMMTKTESGRRWYDILLGSANKKMFAPVENELTQQYLETRKIWDNAADIGSGTGDTLRAIAPFCEYAVGVDMENFVNNIAIEVGLPDNVTVVTGSAQALPFPDASLDLAVSNGLAYYLSPSETEEFIQELFRVLRPGAKFYQSYLGKSEEAIVPQAFHSVLESAKAALLNLTRSIANGNGDPESLSLMDFTKSMMQHGFAPTNFTTDDNHAMLLEFTKLGSE